jgi:hypothetical protein
MKRLQDAWQVGYESRWDRYRVLRHADRVNQRLADDPVTPIHERSEVNGCIRLPPWRRAPQPQYAGITSKTCGGKIIQTWCTPHHDRSQSIMVTQFRPLARLSSRYPLWLLSYRFEHDLRLRSLLSNLSQIRLLLDDALGDKQRQRGAVGD